MNIEYVKLNLKFDDYVIIPIVPIKKKIHYLEI